MRMMLIYRVSGNQLGVPAIISNAFGGDNCNRLDEVSIIAHPEPKNTASSKKKKSTWRQDYEWKKETKTAIRQETFPEPNYSYESVSKVELFELFFYNKLIDLIVGRSAQYCLYKNWSNLNVMKEEIKVFLGILLFRDVIVYAAKGIASLQEMICETRSFI